VISRDTLAAREVVTSSKNGFPWQASVGASVEDFEFVKNDEPVLVNGRQHSGPLNVVRRSTLGEISFVDLGADGSTSASVIASSNFSEGALEVSVSESQTSANSETESTQPATSTVQAAQPPAASVEASQTVEQIRVAAAAELDRI